ncbi:MAG: hypothetical protein MJA83_19055 [Gammaproteobacteria bacterium]|nr:hypothetical protein [Gammaproteobacteria bacterium]
MTISLLQLWLPILAGGVLAWIASGLIHMLLKYHNSDYLKLPNEDEVMGAVRNGSPPIGLYTFPHCADMSAMNDEGVQQKFKNGPVGIITVFPNGLPNMPVMLGQQIAFFIIGNALIAYCATLALTAGADFMPVFRFCTAVGFLAYGWATIPYSIWFGHPWSMTFKYIIDALIYALVVAATFAWLWPAAG